MSEEEAIAADAKALGLSPEQVVWSGEVNRVSTQLKIDYSDDFSYAKSDPAKGVAEVGFKGDVPAAAVKVAQSVSGVVVRGDVGYSELGLNEDVSAILRITEKHASAIGNGYAGADIESRTITVVFDHANDDSTSSADVERATQRIQAEVSGLERKAPMFRVVVQSSTEPAVEPQAFDGGRLLPAFGRSDD